MSMVWQRLRFIDCLIALFDHFLGRGLYSLISQTPFSGLSHHFLNDFLLPLLSKDVIPVVVQYL
jgi:hypothetical protein